MATRLRELDVDLITRDPAEADIEGVRRIPDDIAERVRRLLAELTEPAVAG